MLLLAALAIVPFHFHFDASEFANAVYHAGCMAERVQCTRQVYVQFWNEKYHATSEDNQRFDQFRGVFRELEHAAGPPPPTPFLPNYISSAPALRIRTRLMAAALASKSGKEFRRRAAQFAPPEDVERLAQVLEYFERRLHPWWQSTGRAIAQQRAKAVEQRMTRLGMPKLAEEAAQFFEVNESSRDLYVHLIPSPAYDGDDAGANPSLNHFCIEVTHDFDVDQMASVAMHELTHALYELAPSQKQEALMRRFVQASDPAAQPLYMFLNEALATGVQLLLLERNGKKEDDPYHDPFIPRLGQAAMPLIRDAMARHKTLFDDFPDNYLANGRKALGEDTDGIPFRFSAAALLGDSNLVRAYLGEVPLHFLVTTEEEWKLFARLNGIRLLTYGEAGGLGASVEGLQDQMRHRGFVYVRKLPQAEELDVVGRDSAAVGELAKRLAASKEAMREGIIFTID